MDHYTTYPQVNIAFVSLVVQNNARWFPNSGETTHLTNASPSSHHTCVPYTRQGKVVVDNGTSLNIYVVGSTVIPSACRQLLLQNMLFTLCLTKSLIFVS